MKAIKLIADDPKLQEFEKRIALGAKQGQERMMFLRKQAEDVGDELRADARKIWVDIAAYLKESGMLPPDFNKEKHGLKLDSDAGAIFMYDIAGECDGSGNHKGIVGALITALENL